MKLMTSPQYSCKAVSYTHLEMEGAKDADGKTVKGEAKSDHVREWLEDFSGLTDEQRAFLWGTVYTSEW